MAFSQYHFPWHDFRINEIKKNIIVVSLCTWSLKPTYNESIVKISTDQVDMTFINFRYYTYQIKSNYHRTLHNVHCTLYSVHCTLYSVQCTVYTYNYNARKNDRPP